MEVSESPVAPATRLNSASAEAARSERPSLLRSNHHHSRAIAALRSVPKAGFQRLEGRQDAGVGDLVVAGIGCYFCVGLIIKQGKADVLDSIRLAYLSHAVNMLLTNAGCLSLLLLSNELVG